MMKYFEICDGIMAAQLYSMINFTAFNCRRLKDILEDLRPFNSEMMLLIYYVVRNIN